jgi:hypothetical protein
MKTFWQFVGTDSCVKLSFAATFVPAQSDFRLSEISDKAL